MGPIVAILHAVLGKLFADESKAWLPWVTERITRLAARKLPLDQQARYYEEWRSHLNQVPGELAKLYVALGFVTAARRMSEDPLVRRCISQFIGLILFILYLPHFVAITVVIAVTSPGPTIFRRPKLNLKGNVFNRFGFRTARVGATQMTAIGKVLARFHLDDLPILLNVCRGDILLAEVKPIIHSDWIQHEKDKEASVWKKNFTT
jgi:hypothetical protein